MTKVREIIEKAAWLAADGEVRGHRGCGDEAQAGYELAEMVLSWAKAECFPVPRFFDEESDTMVYREIPGARALS